MGTETAAIIGAIAAAAGSAAGIAQGAKKNPKQKAAAVPVTRDASPDEARKRLEEEERLRQRRGRASTLLQGEAGPLLPAATQSGGKTVLGG